MTPLETEEGRLRYLLEDSKISSDGMDNVIQCFKDAYAHELAEKIRTRKQDGHDQVSCVPCFIFGEAANLIDPEVH